MAKLKECHIDRFEKAVKELNSLMSDIRKYLPNANYFLANSTLNVMNDDHLSFPDSEEQECIVANKTLKHSSGGDF
jgi:hypothetical protein